jgi:hypothetical protein
VPLFSVCPKCLKAFDPRLHSDRCPHMYQRLQDEIDLKQSPLNTAPAHVDVH